MAAQICKVSITPLQTSQITCSMIHEFYLTQGQNMVKANSHIFCKLLLQVHRK